MSDTLDVDIPKKLLFLFEPYRYKVAHGGRGSSKSWSFARALIILSFSRPLRILCTREVQKSIKESVKRLLDDQIQAMGLGQEFESLDTEIRGRNGSLFSFAGLAQHTVESVKSYEGYDIVWVEEAQTVSKKSWDILIPTIRKPGSEIWISFNPELDTDETWSRFVEKPPPNSFVAQVNYTDNPWFPDVLEQERLHSKATAPEDYDNIWEGKCRSAVAGAIYAKEVQQATVDGRIMAVPYNPQLKVHTIWDLGFNDSMTILMAQKSGPSGLAVIDYIEDSQRTLDWYVTELNQRRYNWGDDWIPHDGTHKDFKTGMSTETLLKRMKRNPKITPNIGIEAGIKLARMIFARCYFDKDKTSRLLECLKRYRRAISTTTNEPGAPVHDEWSHGADGFRYLAVVADQLTNEDLVIPTVATPRMDSGIGY